MSELLKSRGVFCDQVSFLRPCDWQIFAKKNGNILTTTQFGSNSKFILHQDLYYYNEHQE